MEPQAYTNMKTLEEHQKRIGHLEIAVKELMETVSQLKSSIDKKENTLREIS